MIRMGVLTGEKIEDRLQIIAFMPPSCWNVFHMVSILGRLDS